eukprot:4260752-Amphidinium_carterae.1
MKGQRRGLANSSQVVPLGPGAIECAGFSPLHLLSVCCLNAEWQVQLDVGTILALPIQHALVEAQCSHQALDINTSKSMLARLHQTVSRS